ncbi:hypothetical protein ACFE04_020159 [Oxalis oulophora]
MDSLTNHHRPSPNTSSSNSSTSSSTSPRPTTTTTIQQQHQLPSPRPINRSESINPYPTTFVQADTSSFKQVVQMLTGSPKPDPSTTTKTHNNIPPIKSIIPKKQSFKLYERRNSLKHNFKINPLINPNPNYPNPNSNNTYYSAFSPRKQQEILSPSILDFPSLVLSPVTPLIHDPFDRSGSGLINSDRLAEEKAIKDKGFYFHRSPATTPRGESPRLLPLFPVTSPRSFAPSSHGGSRIHSQIKTGSLKFTIKGFSFVCQANSSGGRNDDRNSFSRNQKQRNNLNNRQKEIVKLFWKVQAQLRERAAIKGKKKNPISESRKAAKDGEAVDSLRKLLRKHSVEQDKKKENSTLSFDQLEQNGPNDEDKIFNILSSNSRVEDQGSELEHIIAEYELKPALDINAESAVVVKNESGYWIDEYEEESDEWALLEGFECHENGGT